MKRSFVLSIVVGLVAPVAIGAAVTQGADSDTGCWDEYNVRGTRLYRVVVPRDVPLDDCTPGAGCFWGYDTKGDKSRLYVPHDASPRSACDTTTTTTTSSTTSTTTTSSTTTTTVVVPPDGGGNQFTLQPVGAVLPSDAECASRVRPMTENRPGNVVANATRGARANADYPRVTGDFVGTTDEIIQWTACKWGIDEDWVRAQIMNESAWNQNALGDFATSGDACSPRFPIGNYPPQYSGDRTHANECPESVGLGQVRWLYHRAAFDDDNAIDSSAYNLDYTYAVWRSCYEGQFGWLNDVEGRKDYAAGDAKGCLGVWFAGRWYTDAAIGYIARFDDTLGQRPWEQSWFPPAFDVTTGVATTTVPTTAAPTTAAPTTAVVTTAAPTTAVPTTAVPTTVVPPAGGQGDFFEDFSGNVGLERFETGMYHRDDFLVAATSWTGDHDASCGSPDTQRTIRRDRPNESFYMCRDHLMTSVGDTSGYSIAWFAPKQRFRAGETTQVSFDVNVTDLGNRQWWEVSLVPIGSPFLATVDWVAVPAGIAVYDAETIVVGKGPFGNDGNIVTKGVQRDPMGYGHVCGGFAADPEGCGSKSIRRTFTITDNRNGTVTFDFLGKRYTYPGEFPAEFEVYFKDHNYTPDKDGTPVGHTWHWDNIAIH